MPRKKKEEAGKLALSAPGEGLQVGNYTQCREILVQALNAMIQGKLSAGEAKSVSYLVQTILSCLHKEHELSDVGHDSIRELVGIIKEERLKAKTVN